MILIGIDVGKNTGVAVQVDGVLTVVETHCIISAMALVKAKIDDAKSDGIKIFIEDARLRKWVTGGREKLQGVGSVKRDSGIWEEFCIYYGVDFQLVAPKDNKTKLSSDTFKHYTGWRGRTSEHARDAAMLIWGR